MIVQYSYISWSPPFLSEQEELELGRQIAVMGREAFERKFRESIRNAETQNRKRGKLSPEMVNIVAIVVSAAIVLLTGGVILIPLVVLGTPILLVYYVSAWLAVRRFNKWMDHLVANYAAHAAKSNSH